MIMSPHYIGVSVYFNIFFQGFGYDLLLHGTNVKRPNAFVLESILKPFSPPVWMVLSFSLGTAACS